ncbi:hypothetical protein KDA_57180 [Dictyobacter alpinus]|uniref:Uncharacterized protein n=1 Tax=Dictyobacter alpinus TaxID=2014873 RepID=A0A402BFU2_9CHLR|nr:DUF6114 domain-containing protein [Dictyobacter alpinus]GCE30234.1 hypothetical protein KDA_57180 [Dictyobacter alpinus]
MADPTKVQVQTGNDKAEENLASTPMATGRIQWMRKRLSMGWMQVQPRLQWFRRSKKASLRTDDWRTWSQFQLWRRTRPFTGSILIILAGLLVLWGPAALLPFALLPGSNIWAGILVGGLLLVMGLIQLLAPTNALVAGSIAVVLSLVSLIVAAGGFGIGMLLGITGGAMGIAWQPVSRSHHRTRFKLPAPIKHLFIRPH